MTDLQKKTQGIFFIALLCLVALQTILPIFPNGSLSGEVIAEEPVAPSLETILSGAYLDSLNQRIEQDLGFKPYLVRLHNQINYSLLNYVQPTSSNIVLGKDGWLYEGLYLFFQSHEGDMPMSDVELLATELKTIQDFCQSRGSDLFLIIAPSKANIYPEFAPDYYQARFNQDHTRTNYQKLQPLLLRKKVNFIDGVDWYLKRKVERPDEMLFSRGGTHWSEMSAFHFLQHAIDKMNTSPHVQFAPLELSGTREAYSEGYDEDILVSINLWNTHQGRDLMPYPKLQVHPKPSADTPSTIVIGDSFSWILNRYLARSNIAPKLDMYYYFLWKMEYRDGKEEKLPMEPFDLEKLAQPGQAIVLLCNEISLSSRFWGFVDQSIAQIHAAEKR